MKRLVWREFAHLLGHLLGRLQGHAFAMAHAGEEGRASPKSVKNSPIELFLLE